MYRSVYLLVLIFSVCRRARSSSSSVTQTVRPGANITLHCNISTNTEMVWYRHINHELTVIISASRGNLDKELTVNHNEEPERFKLNYPDPSEQVSSSLVIMDIRQSDIGLYYCGARHNGVMNFTRAVHVQFTDAVGFSSGTAQCWTPLISVCCAFAVMLTLLLSVVYKRGLSPSSCLKCVKDDGVEEADLHYASLRHNAMSREREASPANHNVIYDKVARNVAKNPSV